MSASIRPSIRPSTRPSTRSARLAFLLELVSGGPLAVGLAAVSLLTIIFFGCDRAAAPERDAALAVRILAPTQDGRQDDRTYSVGSVQFRTVDADDVVLSSEVVPIDRSTGIIDAIIRVPAGQAHRILVEPLGSAVLPNGGRTESGVALRGVSPPLDIEAGEAIEIEVALQPFIPDGLRTTGSPPSLLIWQAMPPAESHTVRVLVFEHESAEPSRTLLVPVPTGNTLAFSADRAVVERLGFQVRSESRFGPGAFSDTLVVTVP